MVAAVAVFAAVGCSPTGGNGTPGSAASDDKPSASDGASDDGKGGPALPGMPTAEEAVDQLEQLEVARHGSMTGYSREKFPHWAEQGESCDTRETVLERDGTDVEQNDACRAVSGSWFSVYDDETFTDSSDLDIDHMVPLANAWRSGARTWSQEKRKEFANDLSHPQLIAVSASSNRSKGDQGPDEWQPPSKPYWCDYGRAWTSVKFTYELSVTEDEKDMLDQMLDTCEA